MIRIGSPTVETSGLQKRRGTVGNILNLHISIVRTKSTYFISQEEEIDNTRLLTSSEVPEFDRLVIGS